MKKADAIAAPCGYFAESESMMMAQCHCRECQNSSRGRSGKSSAENLRLGRGGATSMNHGAW
jgi:hypothetical protein